MNRKRFVLLELMVLIMIVGIISVLIIGFFSCGNILTMTDNENATRILMNQGYTDIQIIGYEPFACADEDDFSTAFTAKNHLGINTVGVVCTSFWGKYGTIRLK